jgi:tetratricopeptide (TPR) repeat protein
LNPTDADLLRILRPLQLAVETDPESADAHYQLAAADYELGQLELCWQQLTRALLLDPEHEQAHYLTGLLGVGYGMGSASDINIVYNRTYLDSMDSHLLYGMTLFREGFRHKGISVLSDAAARYPTSTDAHRMLGAALFDSGSTVAGIAETVKALQLAPDSAPAVEQLRVMFKAQGMNENDAEVRIQALKSAPPNAH